MSCTHCIVNGSSCHSRQRFVPSLNVFLPQKCATFLNLTTFSRERQIIYIFSLVFRSAIPRRYLYRGRCKSVFVFPFFILYFILFSRAARLLPVSECVLFGRFSTNNTINYNGFTGGNYRETKTNEKRIIHSSDC